MGVMNESSAITSTNNGEESSAKQKLNEIQNLLKSHIGLNADSIEERRRLPGITEILPSLYLCGAGVAIPIYLQQLGITCVINSAPELPDTPLPDAPCRPQYLQIPILDKSDVNIRLYFDEAADLIENIRLQNGKTLVHCVAGVSRSASLCLAYLMKYMKMTLKDAYYLVKSLRPQIRPNTGFFRDLIDYEKNLYGSNTVAMVYKESLGQEIPDVYEPEYKAMEIFYQKHRHLKLR